MSPEGPGAEPVSLNFTNLHKFDLTADPSEPQYVASGTVLVAFPLLRAGSRDVLAPALHSFEALALAAAVVLATVPLALVLLFLPEQYIGSTVLMPQLAAAGLGAAGGGATGRNGGLPVRTGGFRGARQQGGAGPPAHRRPD